MISAVSNRRSRRPALAALGIAIALLGGGPAPARAQNVSFTVAPYFWATNVSARVAIGGTSTTFNKSFVDVIKESETAIAFSGFGAVHYGNWSFFLDGLYSRLTADTSVGPIPTTTRSVTSLLDFGLSYKIGLTGGGPGEGTAFSVEPYVGGRYVNLSTRIRGQNLGLIDVSKSFAGVDPIFGARLHAEIDPRWRVTIAGDIGGGAATNLTWSAAGMVGYRFELGGVVSTVWFGYKALGIDLTGGGALPLRVNQILHGPIIGSSFRF